MTLRRLRAVYRLLARERTARLLARDPWLTEHRAKLAEFKRLHGHLFK